MLRRITILTALAASTILAQQPAAAPAAPGAGAARGGGMGSSPVRPPLFLKEEWKQNAAGGEHPVDLTESIANPSLELKLYGTDAVKNMDILGVAGSATNPIHLWNGSCEAPNGATLRDKNNFVDLTGMAMIRWVTKTSGFHQVRPLLKTAEGIYLVGDHADGSTADWHTNEFSISDVRWRRLNIAKVVTVGDWVKDPDLSKIDEVGFVDLLPGSGHGPGGWVDVGPIEVFGKPVKR